MIYIYPTCNIQVCVVRRTLVYMIGIPSIYATEEVCFWTSTPLFIE